MRCTIWRLHFHKPVDDKAVAYTEKALDIYEQIEDPWATQARTWLEELRQRAD